MNAVGMNSIARNAYEHHKYEVSQKLGIIAHSWSVVYLSVLRRDDLRDRSDQQHWFRGSCLDERHLH